MTMFASVVIGTLTPGRYGVERKEHGTWIKSEDGYGYHSPEDAESTVATVSVYLTDRAIRDLWLMVPTQRRAEMLAAVLPTFTTGEGE